MCLPIALKFKVVHKLKTPFKQIFLSFGNFLLKNKMKELNNHRDFDQKTLDNNET